MSDRNLNDLLRRFGENLAAGINVCMPGEVTRYDRAKRKADVLPHLRRVYADGRADDMPVIVNVPVWGFFSGGAFIDMPIKKGDRGIIMFADRAMDTWLASGAVSTPPEILAHALSDAIFIPGLKAFNEGPLTPADGDPGNDLVMAYAGAVYRIRENGSHAIKGNVALDGNLEVDGTIDCTKTIHAAETISSDVDVIADGISLKNHVHINGGGTGNSGPPAT